MAKSLQDQLLNAGLATEEQLQKAHESKKRPPRKPQMKAKNTDNKAPQNKSKKKKQPASDLAQFYQQRNSFERKTREEEEKKKKEAVRLKKLNNKKIRQLLLNNLQNVEDAEIRYNFVVGTNIKFIYVTEQQQEALGKGELAITFLGGKRCLIPVKLVDELRQLEPSKLIITLQCDIDEDADMSSSSL